MLFTEGGVAVGYGTGGAPGAAGTPDGSCADDVGEAAGTFEV